MSKDDPFDGQPQERQRRDWLREWWEWNWDDAPMTVATVVKFSLMALIAATVVFGGGTLVIMALIWVGNLLFS